MSIPYQTFEDLELRVFCSGGSYRVAELNFADGRRVRTQLPELPASALAVAGDLHAYGVELFQWLFRDKVGDEFARTQHRAGMRGATGTASNVRLRLWLDPQCELSNLRWETLWDPEMDEPLGLNTSYSRFLPVKAARCWPISERPLRMLAVAGADDLAQLLSGLETLLALAPQSRWGPLLDCQSLRSAPTLFAFMEVLRNNYHILHLLARVDNVDGEQFLLLPDENGTLSAVPDEHLAELFMSVSPPFLVFLGLCAPTAEESDAQVQRLSHMLLDAGVQAVVCFQIPLGEQGFERLHRFTERFYAVLLRTGVIDLAVATGRAALFYDLDQVIQAGWPDPVLTMRTADAQLFQPLPG